jgi:hypothetical protein
MYSGLALLMDVFTPEKPNGYGVIFINGRGWAAPLDYGSRHLKNGSEQWNALALPLIRAALSYSPLIIGRRPAFARADGGGLGGESRRVVGQRVINAPNVVDASASVVGDMRG